MGQVPVIIIDPDGEYYEASVEQASDAEELKDQLVAGLKLPQDEEYKIAFNTNGIFPNTEITITRIVQPLYQNLRRRGSGT